MTTATAQQQNILADKLAKMVGMFSVEKGVNKEVFLTVTTSKLGKVMSRVPIAPDGTIIMPNGSTPIFRKSVSITGKIVLNEDERQSREYNVMVLDTIGCYLLDTVNNPKFVTHINRVIGRAKREDAETLLRELIIKCINDFYKPICEWDVPGSDFESYAQKNTFVLMPGNLPILPGEFATDVEGIRRLKFFDIMVNKYDVTRYAATQVGNPGTTADRCDVFGYPAHLRVQPLAHFCHSKRIAVQRGLTHLLKVRGADKPFVKIKEIEDLKGTSKEMPLPSMVNLHVMGTDIHLNDAVIMSESAAKKLTGYQDKIATLDIDSLINSRGGIKFKGNKGYPVQKMHNYKVWVKVGDDVVLKTSPIQKPSCKSLDSYGSVTQVTSTTPKLDYMGVLSELRLEWVAKYGSGNPLYTAALEHFLTNGGDLNTWNSVSVNDDEAEEWWGGDSSPRQMAHWTEWRTEHKLWIEAKATWSNTNRPVITRYASAGIDRAITVGISRKAVVLYREYQGEREFKPQDGAKVQSEADAFKGVVTILSDENMPVIEYDNGVKVRADVVCDISKSTLKHGSLRFSHLTMVLNTVASFTEGGITVSHMNPLSVDDIVDLALASGVYADDDLKATVYDRSGKHLLTCPTVLDARYPCGILRVGRHRQDPDINGGVVGALPEDTSSLRNTLKDRGVRNGFIDGMIQISCGFDKAVAEIRQIDPMLEAELECIRTMVTMSPADGEETGLEDQLSLGNASKSKAGVGVVTSAQEDEIYDPFNFDPKDQ